MGTLQPRVQVHPLESMHNANQSECQVVDAGHVDIGAKRVREITLLFAGDDVDNRELEDNREVNDANSNLESLFATLELPISILPLLLAQVKEDSQREIRQVADPSTHIGVGNCRHQYVIDHIAICDEDVKEKEERNYRMRLEIFTQEGDDGPSVERDEIHVSKATSLPQDLDVSSCLEQGDNAGHCENGESHPCNLCVVIPQERLC